MKKSVFFTVLMAFLLLAGCGTNTETIKIGVILPQTGFGALAAQQCQEGIELALDSINSVADGAKYEVVYEDCQSQVASAVAAYKRLSAMGVKYFIVDGGQYTLGVAPLTKGEDVIMMAVSTPNPDAVKVTDRLVRVSPLAKTTVNELAHYAIDSLNAKKGAVIYINNDAYRLYNKLFCDQFVELGGIIVGSEGCATDTRDFKDVAAKMGRLNPDFIFVAAIGEQVGLITNQLLQNPKLSGKPILGNMNMGDPSVKKTINIEGQFIKYVDVRMASFYDTIYREKYGTAPNSLSAQSYSALMVLFAALKGQQGVDEQLSYIKGTTFNTAISPLSFEGNGECNIEMTMYSL